MESEFDRLAVRHFLTVHKDLEPGRRVEGATRVGRTGAEAEIEASIRRHHDRLASGRR
jgi:inorganic pyrophosphatase